jgi:hypothetical protein
LRELDCTFLIVGVLWTMVWKNELLDATEARSLDLFSGAARQCVARFVGHLVHGLERLFNLVAASLHRLRAEATREEIPRRPIEDHGLPESDAAPYIDAGANSREPGHSPERQDSPKSVDVARSTKTLQEHLRDGSFRADRDGSLPLGPLVDDN